MDDGLLFRLHVFEIQQVIAVCVCWGVFVCACVHVCMCARLFLCLYSDVFVCLFGLHLQRFAFIYAVTKVQKINHF